MQIQYDIPTIITKNQINFAEDKLCNQDRKFLSFITDDVTLEEVEISEKSNEIEKWKDANYFGWQKQTTSFEDLLEDTMALENQEENRFKLESDHMAARSVDQINVRIVNDLKVQKDKNSVNSKFT